MRFLSVIIFFLFAVHLHARERNALFQNFTVREGLSQNTVIRALEDSKGYMWFCTRDGLNRFDGTEFEVFRTDSTENSLTSSDVTTIVEQTEGIFWIGTHSGLNRYDFHAKAFTRFYHRADNERSLSNNCIKHLLCDSKKRIWVGTISGLDLYNPETKDFTPVTGEGSIFWLMQNRQGEICFLVNNTLCIMDPETYRTEKFRFDGEQKMFFLYEDSDQNLWVGMWDSGLKLFDRKNGKLLNTNLRLSPKDDFTNVQVNYIVETADQDLMLATRNGVLLYDRKADRLLNSFRSEDAGGLSENTTISLYRDRSDNIWIGTYGGGVNLYTPYSNFFIPHNPGSRLQKNMGNINAFVEHKGKLWLGTDGGLLIYDPLKHTYEVCHFDIPRSATNREIKFIQKEGDRYLWVSIYYCGLYLLDRDTRRVVREVSDFPYNQVRRIVQAKDNTYWIALGVDSPILLYDFEHNTHTDKIEIAGKKFPISFINVQDVYAEADYIWMGTRAEGLYRYHLPSKELKYYGVNAEGDEYIPTNHVSTLYKDTKGNLWIGTFGGGLGLYNRIKENFRIFNQEQGLANNAINAISEDDLGNLWIATLEGMSRFDPKEEVFENWNYSNGYRLLETNLHACLRGSDKHFYMGGNNQFLSFDPHALKRNTRVPPVYISKVMIWADNLGKDTVTWVKPDARELRLRHDQTSFTIRYSALNYVYAENNAFSYMLEGFDNGWSRVTSERSVNYTNISPGSYTFRVRARNNDGVWNETGDTLRIIVTPPVWKTWYAYLCYIAVIIGLISLFVRYRMREERLKLDLKIKQMEKNNAEQSHRLGVQMFTNFSHELRTPLTLILAPLSELLNRTDLSPGFRKPHELMNKNSQRLLWLVNRLMDFRKLEAGKMNLRCAKYDLDEFIGEVMESFRPLADKKNVALEFNNTSSSGNLWFDMILLEKVMFNLLSNALKHTPEGGYVWIKTQDISPDALYENAWARNYTPPANNEGLLLIRVEDSGKGIAADMMPRIFEAFFQAGENDYTNLYGSGIGLNLSKSIVELHGGCIGVESEEGRGTVVSFCIPLGRGYLNEDQILNKTKMVKSERPSPSIPLLQEEGDTVHNPVVAGKPENRLLIIEDNKEVRDYLVSILSGSYFLSVAPDCREGYEMIEKQMPDLVVSDIMTPYMNGIELTRLVKSNVATSHIPIILLTARVAPDQIREGWESLADDYIVKPFDPELLKVRITNLLTNRKKLRESYGKRITTGTLHGEVVSMEDKFMEKVLKHIKDNLDNIDFSIDQFSNDIGISRIQLYRKIKALTDMSPSKLILDIRLKTAAGMLKDTDMNVTEISYRCGFNEISYFGKCFKAEYGVTPSEYIRLNREI